VTEDQKAFMVALAKYHAKIYRQDEAATVEWFLEVAEEYWATLVDSVT
jgi:hypothetical protein